MQKAGEEQKGTMAAVLGLTPQLLEEICKEASSAGVVQVANFNSPGQTCNFRFGRRSKKGNGNCQS